MTQFLRDPNKGDGCQHCGRPLRSHGHPVPTCWEASPAQESEPVGYTSQGYIDGVKNSIGDLGNFAGNFFKRKWKNVNIPLYTRPLADKADAERLGYLENNWHCVGFSKHSDGWYGYRDKTKVKTLREAIDKAMKG